MDQQDSHSGPQQSEPAQLAPAGQSDDVEAILWRGRTCWKHFSGQLVLWALASIVYGAVVIWAISRIAGSAGRAAGWIAAGPIVVSGLLVGGRLAARIASQRYRITHQRLFIDRGLLTRTIDQTELIRVDDVRVRKTLVDQLFGLGSVEILSTDLSDRQVVIVGVSGADEVAETIRRQMRGLRKKSLFVESL